MTKPFQQYFVEVAVHLLEAALVFLSKENLKAHERLFDQRLVVEKNGMQIKLDLIQIEHILTDLPVNLVELLIVVRPLGTAWLIVQELACTKVLRLEQSPCESFHHDNLSLLQIYAPCVSH